MNPTAHLILDSLLHVHELDQLYSDLTILSDLGKAQALEKLRQRGATVAEQLTAVVTPLRVTPLRQVLEGLLSDESVTDKDLVDFAESLRRQAGQRAIVRLTVAVPFEEPDLRDMAAAFAQRIGQPVLFDMRVDHSLIGGAIVEHGSFSSDYSLRTRLSQFRDQWKAAVKEPA